MNILLLDTDVVSFILKGDSRANKYSHIIQGNRLALSFMTVADTTWKVSAIANSKNQVFKMTVQTRGKV